MSDIYRDSIFWVEVERIKPNPFQPRREFDQSKLQELSESIRMYGLLQPLTVTRHETAQEDGGITVGYELIAGERRLRASKLASLTQVPVIIRTGEQTDQVKLELAIIENLQREDLNPMDRAVAFSKLHKDFNFTHLQIGKKVGKSREYVSNTLRLLTLPEDIQGHLASRRISEGHTRPLMMLNDRPEEQTVLVKEIILKKLSVRESEALARRAAQDKVSAKHKIDPEVLALERTLTEKLGTRVTIESREVGGRMVISFFSAEDLDALLQNMQMQREEQLGNVFNGSVADADKMAQSVSNAVNAPTIQQPEQPAPVQEVKDEVPVETEASVTEKVVSASEIPATETTPPVQETPVEEKVTPELKETVNTVTADPERPTPEPSESKKESEHHSFMDAALAALGGASEPVTQEAVAQPQPEPQSEPKQKEEDNSDLYSIRNFSI